jgi:hypothetical protein
MVEGYSQMRRRDFLRQLGIGTLGVVAASYVPDLSYAQGLNNFRCTFYVNIFGRGWVEDNSKMNQKIW